MNLKLRHYQVYGNVSGSIMQAQYVGLHPRIISALGFRRYYIYCKQWAYSVVTQMFQKPSI